jgi:PAS domain S-box-containing protein
MSLAHITMVETETAVSARTPDQESLEAFRGPHQRVSERRGIVGHAFCAAVFVALFLLLNRPEVIVIAHLGSVVWYPATGLAVAFMLAISPGYGVLAAVSIALAGVLIYDQPALTWSGTVGAVAVAGSFAGAACVLRGSLHIDVGLRRQRDVVRYVSATTLASLGSTLVGTACLAADQSIPWGRYGYAAIAWFLADEISLLGVAPFLIIYVLPWVRRLLFLDEAQILPRRRWRRPKDLGMGALLEAGGQTFALVLALWLMFGSTFGDFRPSFLCVIPIVWMAMRQGIRRVVAGLLALNFGIVIGLHYGPTFPGLQVKASLLMMVVSATGLIVGAAVNERQRITRELGDLTRELSRTNAELRSQTAFLEAQANSTIDGSLVVDEHGQVLLRNQRMLDIFKVPAGILADGADQPLLAHVVTLVKDPESFLAKVRYLYDHPGETSRDEIELKDGTILDRYSAPVNDKDGKYYGRIWTFRDVTERRRNEEDLRQLSVVVDQSPASIVITDSQGNISYVNRKFTQITGYAPEEAIGANPRLLKSGYVSDDVYRNLWKVITSGGEWRGELCNKKKNGELFWESATISPITNAKGSICHFLAIKEDITERRSIESQLRQAQKLEAVGQLAAGIAHEINTPTQFVTDNLTFLRDACKTIHALLEQYRNVVHGEPGKTVDPLVRSKLEQADRDSDLDFLIQEMPSAIEQALEGAARVAKIVRAMKEFSHPDSTEKALADLNKAIDTTITVARNEWKYFADVETVYDSNLPPINCHLGEVNQVILNLVVNAAHAIKDKIRDGEKGLITISTRGKDDVVEISVTDTGMGIPESIRSRVFDPFFTTKDVGKGTGQGLALAYTVIVKKHGGKIWFETEAGRGTTFFLQLPA